MTRIKWCAILPLMNFGGRSEEHTSELQSHLNLVCRLLLEKKKHTGHLDAGGQLLSADHHYRARPAPPATRSAFLTFASQSIGPPVQALLHTCVPCCRELRTYSSR